jgi:hypothetical protein
MRFTLILATFITASSSAGAAGRLTFNKDIRPILSDQCFHCHGFDSKTRRADLRLDERQAAIDAGAIVPGDADASEIIIRMVSHDPDEVMPPPKSKLPKVSDQDLATLKQWINDGAEYEAHWAFIPVPALDPQRNIDVIVKEGLQARGLDLQPVAASETLARRLSFDITGLPPSPAVVADFAAKSVLAGHGSDTWRTTVLEPYVDGLLRSPHYGERMAVDWLDVSRYADSYGFQVDRPREVWVWRDWVIDAFNKNLRYDDFVMWQVAGDMLPNPSEEQVLATAFSRLHQQESEGGSVEEEYRVEYVADRVHTFATAFLGLTFECARCHDHKYDPISHKDYYSLFAMFQNIDEAGLYSFFTEAVPTPALSVLDEAGRAKLKQAQERVAMLEARATGEVRDTLPAPALATALAHYRFDELLPGNVLAAEGDVANLPKLGPAPPPAVKKKVQVPEEVEDGEKEAPPAAPTLQAKLKGENRLAAGRRGQAIQFTGDDAVSLPIGNFNRHDPFSISLSLKVPDRKERAVVFHRSRAWTDAGSRGYELLIEDGRLKWSLIHFWPGDAISIKTKAEVPFNEWLDVVVTNDGSSRANGLGIFINGKRAEVDVLKDSLTRNITGGGGDTIDLGARFRDRGFKGGAIDDLRVFDVDVSRSVEPALARELSLARAEVTQLADAARQIMVMKELAAPKPAWVLFRGEYDKRTDPVTAQTPEVLGLLPESTPKNRLSLAQWLTDRQHPLFSRVTVNRLWQNVLGRGLVKTSEDFGSQGERPLYPELLDYLSARFMDGGWDVKALLKEIVMSRVYLQRSIADAKTMADDPENQWLARGPRFRLPAEMIRDNALAAAGLLNVKLGGPPVNAYEIAEAFKPEKASDGNEVWRRSLYANWRRTSPPPAMTTFDAPKRSICVVKRDRTDTPLQALVLMNGVQYVEAARVLAQKLWTQTTGDLRKMIESAFMHCLSRKPDAKELAICEQLYQEQLAYYKGASAEAEKLMQHGSAPRDDTLPTAELAAATVLCQALLSHDESVVKR